MSPCSERMCQQLPFPHINLPVLVSTQHLSCAHCQQSLQQHTLPQHFLNDIADASMRGTNLSRSLLPMVSIRPYTVAS